jgi:hypothetical protein
MSSKIQVTLSGYRSQMIIQLTVSLTIISAAVFLLLTKIAAKSKWLTLLVALLILSQISILLAAVFYYA